MSDVMGLKQTICLVLGVSAGLLSSFMRSQHLVLWSYLILELADQGDL